ncbi:hypothetical protein V491_00831, partial [Pseudogymnoascus sp. VKM F-3775]
YPGFELEKGAVDGGARDDSSSYYGDASGEDRASVSSRRSGFSIKCQGHEILELAALAFGQPAGHPLEESVVPNFLGADFMDWVENGSSNRSSMCYSECAYEFPVFYQVYVSTSRTFADHDFCGRSNSP